MLDLGIVRGLITVITLSCFMGICWWAYRPSSRDRFERDGWLVFDEDEAERLAALRDGSGVTQVAAKEGRA